MDADEKALLEQIARWAGAINRCKQQQMQPPPPPTHVSYPPQHDHHQQQQNKFSSNSSSSAASATRYQSKPYFTNTATAATTNTRPFAHKKYVRQPQQPTSSSSSSQQPLPLGAASPLSSGSNHHHHAQPVPATTTNQNGVHTGQKVEEEEAALLKQIASVAGAINKHKRTKLQPPSSSATTAEGNNEAPQPQQKEKESSTITKLRFSSSLRPSPQLLRRRYSYSSSSSFPAYSFSPFSLRGRARGRGGAASSFIGRASLRRGKKFANKSLVNTAPSAAQNATTSSSSKETTPVSRSQGDTLTINGILYKMDATGRTLRKVEEAEDHGGSKASTTPQRNARVPKRIVINGSTYTKAKNGHSLILRKDNANLQIPIRRRRRSALNIARATQAKKAERSKRLCLFFNKFGKCRKGDKCPHLHDRSKVAICRKFLKGQCLLDARTCPLSHSLATREQTMPVCYHFLRGVCNREDCPYSHVYVNANAEVCPAFSREGFCPDGASCKLRHTNVCQAFRLHGVCPEGERCKLRHVKKKRKRERTEEEEEEEAASDDGDKGEEGDEERDEEEAGEKEEQEEQEQEGEEEEQKEDEDAEEEERKEEEDERWKGKQHKKQRREGAFAVAPLPAAFAGPIRPDFSKMLSSIPGEPTPPSSPTIASPSSAYGGHYNSSEEDDEAV
ncbi:Zinc finger CCCH domain-containing protein 3 [Balamuthia mandrillaris]